MIKSIEFGEKIVQFSTSFAWTFIYKSQFGQDAAKILIPVIKRMEGSSQDDYGYIFYEELGFTGIASIAWSMARLLNKDLPEPAVWIASFGDDFPISDITDELMPDAILSCFATKKSKAPIPTKTQTKKAPTKSTQK